MKIYKNINTSKEIFESVYDEMIQREILEQWDENVNDCQENYNDFEDYKTRGEFYEIDFKVIERDGFLFVDKNNDCFFLVDDKNGTLHAVDLEYDNLNNYKNYDFCNIYNNHNITYDYKEAEQLFTDNNLELVAYYENNEESNILKIANQELWDKMHNVLLSREVIAYVEGLEFKNQNTIN